MDRLKREMGIGGSVFLGLGSIVGTGVFVSNGIGAGIAGPSVILSIVIGAAVAACNGLNSVQLAANHPVSGGTYEYGYRYLRPALGFIAGWMFLAAKRASAATAALGFSGYLLQAVGAPPLTYEQYTHNTNGATSAWSWNPKNKFHKRMFGTFIDTPVKNLLIGSCWASQIGGIPGAIGAALKCVKRIG